LSFNPFTKKGVFFRKDAFFIGQAFLACVAGFAVAYASTAAADCPQPQIDEYVSVQSVVDGDTVRLADRTLVRLIGINTPEIGYDGAKSQPLALAAKQFLDAELRKHERIGLVYGAERHDRHGRRLAHLFMQDGDARYNVQQLVLEQGLGFWVAVAPNTRFLECYQAAEAKAKTAKIGVWREIYFKPKNAADTQSLKPGFQLLQGTITAVFETRRNFWLKFNDTVALRISHKDIHKFQRADLKALEGKTVIARGWMFKYKKRLTMSVSHPAAIAVN
jgi:endonuclease YncB( thermonuclease family)